jgi:hypothetical protein
MEASWETLVKEKGLVQFDGRYAESSSPMACSLDLGDDVIEKFTGIGEAALNPALKGATVRYGDCDRDWSDPMGAHEFLYESQSRVFSPHCGDIYNSASKPTNGYFEWLKNHTMS